MEPVEGQKHPAFVNSSLYFIIAAMDFSSGHARLGLRPGYINIMNRIVDLPNKTGPGLLG